jgi:non-ribosomal peptide synthase protein (TIGR01720 family)
VDRVGIHDNFFALGGDSILGIQVVARANQAGVRLMPRQIFDHQTVAELAAVADRSEASVEEQEPVTGEAPLSPIQHWFFEREIHDRHHWNQAVLLRARKRLSPDRLSRALAVLLEAHDALRLRFEERGSSWRQFHAPPGGGIPLCRVDLTGLVAEHREEVCASVGRDLQRSLDLAAGPLARVGLIELGPEQRILLVIHHLVVDGVSWRILLSDLSLLLDRIEGDEPVRLPPKTTSFQRWAELLERHARSDRLAEELDHWLTNGRRRVDPLPADDPGGRDLEGLACSVSVTLGADRTEALLRDASQAYGTRIQELLLAALVRALSRWTGAPRYRIDLEGHGREELAEGIDLSRTVGWLTARYPVTLDVRGPGEAELVKSVKEQVRAVPGQGVGYGLLRFLAGPEIAERLRRLPEPEISFNYLGQLDGAFPEEAPFEPASGPVGDLRSARSPRPRPLQVTASVAEDRLGVRFKYGGERYREDTVRALADDFLASLRTIVDHCSSRGKGDYTPSDFPLAEVGQDDLDQIVQQIETTGGGESS